MDSDSIKKVEQLKNRLEDIILVLKSDPNALGLLGLGSIGQEVDRLDQWSDLDFFVLVQRGTKTPFLDDPSWLSRAHPLSYVFRNSPDGFKLLFEDGVFGEMAVFEPQELESIPFAPGRVLWLREGTDPGIFEPKNSGGRLNPVTDMNYIVGELLTCLYVGLCRFRRGEKLSGWRFIQGYCLDRVLELASLRWKPQNGHVDLYGRERRVEQLYPQLNTLFPQILGGYEETPAAAVALLGWVEEFTPVNGALKAEILQLANRKL